SCPFDLVFISLRFDKVHTGFSDVYSRSSQGNICNHACKKHTVGPSVCEDVFCHSERVINLCTPKYENAWPFPSSDSSVQRYKFFLHYPAGSRREDLGKAHNRKVGPVGYRKCVVQEN